MKKLDKSNDKKLVLSKNTIANLTTRSGLKAGGCAKNWTNAASHSPDGCAGPKPQ